MGIKTTALLVFAALSAASAFYQLVPENKELIYEFKTLVKAGTNYPEEYVSEFVLHGKLHIQVVGHNVYMKFADMFYTMYNGAVDLDMELKEIPVGKEVEDLYKPFMVTYDEHGFFTGFSTYPGEKMYTINIKKGVINTFQMEWDQVVKIENKKAFFTREPSVYGTERTHYNVFHADENTYVVEKFHDSTEDMHMYKNMIRNVFPVKCEAEYEKPMSHDSVKEYTISKYEGHFVPKFVSAYGGIYLHPFKAESETLMITTNATYELVKVVPVTTKFTVDSTDMIKDLTFYPYEYEKEYEIVPDVYQGRRHFEQKQLETTVITMLKEIVEYMQKFHIHSNIPDIKHGQLISRIMRPMSFLDVPTIQHIWSTLAEKTETETDKYMFEVFQQLLPMVGSRPTMLHILDVVSHKKVKDHEAKKLLREMPFNVKFPSVKLMKEMEPLLHMDETKVSWPVRKAAIFSFSTLVHKTFESLAKYDKIEMSFGEEYVTEFVKYFKDAKDYDIKMTYLEAMYNMELPSSVPYFKNIIDGTWEVDEHVKLTAMWAVFPMVKEHDDWVYEIYWPIFTDHHEETQHRILAFYFIMEAHPTLSRMINIYWHMQNESNHEVYQFFYKYFHALAHTTDKCKYKSSFSAKQVLAYTHKPNFYGLTTFYETGYYDEEFGFGKSMDTFFVHDDHSFLVKFSDVSNYFNLPTHPYTIFFKVHGIEGFEKIGLNTVGKSETLFNFEEFFKYFTQLKKTKNLHLEIVLYHHDKVYTSYFFDSSKVEELPLFLVSLSEDFIHKAHEVDFSMYRYSKVFMPTEVGYLAVLDWIMPVAKYNNWSVKKETIKEVTTWHVDTTWKVWSHGRMGFAFYNPIADVWQGVNRYFSYDSSYPLYMDVIYQNNPGLVKFTFKKHGDEYKDTWGYRSHVTVMTFVKDDFHYGVLKKSAPEAVHWAVVTKGDKYRHEYVPTEETIYHTGYDHFVTVYDSERLYTNRTLKDLGHFFDFTTDDFLDSDDWFMTFLSKWDHVIYQPWPGTNGIVEKYVPSKEHPVSSFEVSVRAHYDIVRDESFLLPGMKFNTKFTFASQNEGKTLKTWDVHTLLDVNAGHSVYNLKMQFHRIVTGGTPFKYCVEGTKKWYPDHVAGHLTVFEKEGPIETKCTEEDKIFEVKMEGHKHNDQKSEYAIYGECEENVASHGVHHKLLPCYAAHDSYRNYTYDIHYSKNMKTHYKQFIEGIWEAFKGYYYENMDSHDHTMIELEENHYHVSVLYPLYGDFFSMYFTTPDYTYEFVELEDKFMQEYFFYPDTAHFSYMYKFMHHMGFTKFCTLYNDTIHYQYEAVPYQLPAEWTMVLGDKETNPAYAVYAKEMEGSHYMAIKLVHKSHVLTFVPTTKHHYEITLDDTKLAKETYAGEWFFYGQLPQTDYIYVITKHLGIHMYYDGTHLHLDVPKVDVPYYGQCYAKH